MYIFCEDRKRPITSREEQGYIKRNQRAFSGVARPGEIYTFQLCISDDESLLKVNLLFDSLAGQGHLTDHIAAKDITCYNLEGVDADGNSYKHDGVTIDGYQVFWIGIEVPENVTPGNYLGTVRVMVHGEEEAHVALQLHVEGDVLLHKGYDDLWRLSRLQWLNSTMGQEEYVPAGFEPVTLNEQVITIKGRHIAVDNACLPTEITSYFNEDLSGIEEKAYEVLRNPITFELFGDSGNPLPFTATISRENKSSESVQLKSQLVGEKVDIERQLKVEYDGFMSLRTTLIAKEDLVLREVQAKVPFTEYASRYSMGLGEEGGAFQPVDFQWNDEHQDTIWVGNINGGLACTFLDDDYERPFVNVYYNQRKRQKPIWDNEGKGRIRLSKETSGSNLFVTTGSMVINKGESKTFIIDFYMTPFKCINYAKHWQTRYYHPHENAKQTDWLTEMEGLHCNYLNIHHGQELHPFINYPFVEIDAMKSFIQEAHARDKHVKIYYTHREITNHVKELWPFYSLGEEIFPKQNPDEVLFWKAIDPTKWLNDDLLVKRKMWVEENIDETLIPAWQHDFQHGKYEGQTCASILVNPKSRLNNFYLEGLDWLVKTVGIDGIYIDDVAYDRHTMQRVKKILDQKKNATIDFHSWNHMNEHAGMVNCTLLYKELLPYVDSLWFGEGFNYAKNPDYWMVEISGMPFGLMGEMLQNDGHMFRGMVYGMTNRSGWGKVQPTAIYALWDEFHIEASKMYGYWDSNCPVKVKNKKICASAYLKEDAMLIAIGSWSEEDEVIALDIDLEQIGFHNHDVYAKKVAIEGYQQEEVVNLEGLTIEAGTGAILLIKKMGRC